MGNAASVSVIRGHLAPVNFAPGKNEQETLPAFQEAPAGFSTSLHMK